MSLSRMEVDRKSQLAAALDEFARGFWAGEAEICQRFWQQPRTDQEQAGWLRVQVFKEMCGSGLSASPDGLIHGLLRELGGRIHDAETAAERAEFEHVLRVLGQEYNHFRLFADLLEQTTGEPVLHDEVLGWQCEEDRKLQDLRQGIRQAQGRLGEIVVHFTEGGGSALFDVGRTLEGNALSRDIAAACEIVYRDECEHARHAARGLVDELDREEEWAKARELISLICQQRLRMRYEMFGQPIDEGRIAEIANGHGAPARPVPD